MDGPYVLIPYSIGGIYATYWECIYLDEVEGLVFWDMSEITKNVSFEGMYITYLD